MIIFIGNLPATASERDACVFAGLSEGMLPRIIKKDDGNGGLHRYALVHSRSDREGRRLIGRLHGRTCHGTTRWLPGSSGIARPATNAGGWIGA